MKKKTRNQTVRKRHYHCLGKFGYTFDCHARERTKRIEEYKCKASAFAPQNPYVEMRVTTDINRVTCLECVEKMFDMLKKRRADLRKEQSQ